MDQISDAADLWLRLLDDEFWCEIANHEIGSPHVKFASVKDAKLAMLRLAYLKGREDATKSPSTDLESMALTKDNR